MRNERAETGGAAQAGMALWKKFWILFTVVWGLVALLNVATILAFAEQVPTETVAVLLSVGAGVPALLYALGWTRDRLRLRGAGQRRRR